jgi:COMPASS component SWD3
MDDSVREHEAQSLDGHTMLVPEVSWSDDSCSLVSGSFDKTVKLWDVTSGQATYTAETSGFVQTVSFEPHQSSVFYAGTAEKLIHVFDTRAAVPVAAIPNDAMVNSIYVFRTGRGLLSGDANGVVKTWDMRKLQAIDRQDIGGAGGKPISHVHCSRPARGDTEGKFMAINCYDNVLRIYKRTIGLGRGDEPTSNEKARLAAASDSREPVSTRMRLLHTLEGHRNKNWPIKSSFYHGPDYEIGSLWKVQGKKEDSSNSDEEGDDEKESSKNVAKTLDESLLLATGSAEQPGAVYLFDVGGPEGSGELIQKLEGHADRVNAVSFHPKLPVLATCSADNTVRVWTPTSKFSTVNDDL